MGDTMSTNPQEGKGFWPPSDNTGWICPKCGRVYAPNCRECLSCNNTYVPPLTTNENWIHDS